MRRWDLNLRHGRGGVKIAALGRMSAAAQAVNLTQPAMAQALARIEGVVDTPLFDGRQDGLALTDAGAAVSAALEYIASTNARAAGAVR